MLNDGCVIKPRSGIAILLTVEHYIRPVLHPGRDRGGPSSGVHTGIMAYHAGINGLLEGFGSGPVRPVGRVLDFDGIGANFIQDISTKHLIRYYYCGGSFFGAVSPVRI